MQRIVTVAVTIMSSDGPGPGLPTYLPAPGHNVTVIEPRPGRGSGGLRSSKRHISSESSWAYLPVASGLGVPSPRLRVADSDLPVTPSPTVSGSHAFRRHGHGRGNFSQEFCSKPLNDVPVSIR
jgi:hypothetical protein